MIDLVVIALNRAPEDGLSDKEKQFVDDVKTLLDNGLYYEDVLVSTIAM